MKKNTLVKKFKDVGLKLVILDEPFGGNKNIFGMTITRDIKGNSRKEHFEIYPGHKDNIIQVLGTDKKTSQLILFVHEPVRTFTETVHSREKPSGNDRTVSIRGKRNNWDVKQKTIEGKRHYLLGVDERQLFIAELTRGVSSVEDARASLGRSVTLAEGTYKTSPRQGEWFFIEVSRDLSEYFDKQIKRTEIAHHKNTNIGSYLERSGGNSHTAEYLICLNPTMSKEKLSHGFPVRERQVYIKGKVSHVDHKTVVFKYWRKVIANNEGDNQSVNGWID